MEASAVPREAPAGVATFLPPHVLRLASDARLVAMIREGRSGAFEIAYNRHHRGILSFCRHMLGDPQEAEDAVQQTFLAAYNDLISSTKPIHLRAWLFTIARNRCYSILRARREQPTAEVDEPVTEGLAAQVQVRQDLRDLVRDMRRLPRDQRAALVLAEIDSLNHEQIGEVLGVPREKVKALVFQARESLLASRAARETDCAEIREQLATLRGAGLRRNNLRRHLHDCPGCREFRKQVERQRRRLALIIPVVPTVALKEGVLAGIGGGAGLLGGGIIAGGGGLLASTLLKSSAAKTVMGLMLAGAGTAGTIVAARDLHVQLSGGNSTTHGLGSSPALGPGAAALPAAARNGSALSQSSTAAPPGVRIITTRSWGTAGSRAGGGPGAAPKTGRRSPLLDPFAPIVQTGAVLSVPGTSVPRSVSTAGSTPSSVQGVTPPAAGYGTGGQSANGASRSSRSGSNGNAGNGSTHAGAGSSSTSAGYGGGSRNAGGGSQGGSHAGGYGATSYGGGSAGGNSSSNRSSGRSAHFGSGDSGRGGGSSGAGSSGGGSRGGGSGGSGGGSGSSGAGSGGGSGGGSGSGGGGPRGGDTGPSAGLTSAAGSPAGTSALGADASGGGRARHGRA